MADINRIAKGNLGQVFSRIFGLEEQNAVPTVAPELMPTTSPWERPEFWALTGGNLCVGTVSSAGGGAGTRNLVQLTNPANSGMILITDEIRWGDNLSWVYLGMNTISGLNVLANAADSYHRDARRAPNNTVIRGIAGRITSESRATGGMIVPQQYIATVTTNQFVKEPWVIPPGWAIQVAQGTDNQAFTVDFLWREKPITDSEQLTF